jgi:uncharacterized protein (TIGR03085 family)
MGDLVRHERGAICDLFLEVGPDAPTLCGEWTTSDLAAHLYVRENKMLAAGGIMVPALEGMTDKAMARSLDRHGYEGVVDRVRGGPPFGPFRWFEDQANLNEYFVHHEDVRRGDGSGEPRPEDDIADLDEALWRALGRGGKFMTRGARGTGIRAAWPDHAEQTLRSGEGEVTLTGRPSEIVLYLNGRKQVALVDLTGDEEALEKVQQAELGF